MRGRERERKNERSFLYQPIHSPGSDDDGLTEKKRNNNNHAKKTVLECVLRLLVLD